MTEILELKNFEKVCGNLCITILLPQNSKLHVLNTQEDLQKVLNTLLKGLEAGEYPFITIGLAPIAYGKIIKKRGPVLVTPESSEKTEAKSSSSAS